MPTFRVTISNPSNQAMAELVSKYHVSVLDHSTKGDADKGFTVDAFLDAAGIAKVKGWGYTVVQHEDIGEHAKAVRAQVGKGNRYKSKDQNPQK